MDGGRGRKRKNVHDASKQSVVGVVGGGGLGEDIAIAICTRQGKGEGVWGKVEMGRRKRRLRREKRRQPAPAPGLCVERAARACRVCQRGYAAGVFYPLFFVVFLFVVYQGKGKGRQSDEMGDGRWEMGDGRWEMNDERLNEDRAEKKKRKRGKRKEKEKSERLDLRSPTNHHLSFRHKWIELK